MSMNVSTTTAAYANYQNNYKTGTANKKKETAQTTENTKLKENTTESIAEKNLSKAAQKMLENLRGSRNDMDFMVADFENGDNAKDILAQSDKEYTVIFSKEEMEKMASDPKYYAEKMQWGIFLVTFSEISSEVEEAVAEEMVLHRVQMSVSV